MFRFPLPVANGLRHRLAQPASVPRLWLPHTQAFLRAHARQQHSESHATTKLESNDDPIHAHDRTAPRQNTTQAAQALNSKGLRYIETIVDERWLPKERSVFFLVKWSDGEQEWLHKTSKLISRQLIREHGKTKPRIPPPVDLANAPVTLQRLIKAREVASFELQKAFASREGANDGQRWSMLRIANQITWVADLDAGIAAVKAEEAQKALDAVDGTEASSVSQRADAAAAAARAAAAKARSQWALYNSLKSDFRAEAEANPTYLDDSLTEKGNIRAHIHPPQGACPVCEDWSHHAITCPYTQADGSKNSLSHIPSHAFATRLQARFKYDQEFGTAIAYLQKNILYVPYSSYDQESLVPMPTFQDHYAAPPTSAIPILQTFDRRIWFRRIWFPRIWSHTGYDPRRPLLEGYYRTMDDHGHPFVILWTKAAPTHLHSEAKKEIKLCQTFVTRFNSGFRSRYSSSSPPEEAKPIDIIIAHSNWHTSWSTLSARENCLSISVASQSTWSKAAAVGVIHLTTSNSEPDGKFLGWALGNLEKDSQGKYFNASFTSRVDLLSPLRLQNLVRASLRNIEERFEPIFEDEIRDGKRDAIKQLRKWHAAMQSRAVAKYGADSVQALLLKQKRKDFIEDGLTEELGTEAEEQELKDTLHNHKDEDLLGSHRVALAKAAGLPDFETVMALK